MQGLEEISDPGHVVTIDSHTGKLSYLDTPSGGGGGGDITGVTITTDSGGASAASATEGSADFSILGTAGVGVTNSGTTITVTAVPGEIFTIQDGELSQNNFTNDDHTKLDGIETGATADQSSAEIRAAVEAATDSNVFTDADHTKLNGIEASADVTDTANVTSAGALMDSEVDADIKTLSLPASTTISTYGASLVDDADAAAARTTLGLGAGAVLDTAAVANNATTLATGDQIYDFVTTSVSSLLTSLATSVQDVLSLSSQTITATDPGDADALAGWDHSENKFTYLTAADAKTALSLNNVENTALSTWAGSANLTTAGVLSADQIKHEISGASAGDVGHGAEVVYFGSGTVVAGLIYYYKSDGSWEATNANAEATSSGLLGVALDGGDANSVGMCIRGMVCLYTDTTGDVGDVLWLKTTSNGVADDTIPTGNGDIARVIGYCLNADGKRIFFNPDNTFVEITA
jgi:hypothetical protein